MSRTGKKPIPPVQGVTVTIDGRKVSVKGPKGEQSLTLMDIVDAKQTDEGIVIEPLGESREARAAWGTTRALIANMVKGVTTGFEKRLAIQGVGFRAALQGRQLRLSLGYSHEIVFNTPEGVTVTVPTPTEIMISGTDRRQVGQVAADIRAFRKPEPYQGKGVRYVGEYIARKEGKKK